MSAGGMIPPSGGATGGTPQTSSQPTAGQPVQSPAQPMPQAQAPAFNSMTDYSMGFGRVFQQPSFFSPFGGYYGYGQPFGGFGGGFGGYGGGYGGGFGGYGGYQSGIGSLYGGYSPMPYGGYQSYQPDGFYQQGPQPMPPKPMPSSRNAYVKPVPSQNNGDTMYAGGNPWFVE